MWYANSTAVYANSTRYYANGFNASVDAPVITSPGTANGVVGFAFVYQIAATGSPTLYTAAGLPAGLSLNSTTGAISGIPSQSGAFTVAIGAMNAGGASTATLTISLVSVSTVTTRKNRLALDENIFSQAAKDVASGKIPSLALGAPYRLEIGHIMDDAVISIADWASVRLQVTSLCNKQGDRYVDKTTAALIPGLTQTQWDNAAAAHAVFSLTGAETSLDLRACDNGPLYFVITATLSTGEVVPLGNGQLNVERANQVGSGILLPTLGQNNPQLALTASIGEGDLAVEVIPHGPNQFEFAFKLPLGAGGIPARTPAKAISDAYSLLADDPDIEADATSAAFNVTAFAAGGNADKEKTIYNVGSANSVTLALVGGDLFTNGDASVAIPPGGALTFRVNSSGSKFMVKSTAQPDF